MAGRLEDLIGFIEHRDGALEIVPAHQPATGWHCPGHYFTPGRYDGPCPVCGADLLPTTSNSKGVRRD